MGLNDNKAYPESVRYLIEEFSSLPGIGRRTAERLAFHILRSDRVKAIGLAKAVKDVKDNVRNCSICYNFTEADPCPICRNPKRDHSMILVVEEPKDVISFEQTGMYKGGYHVLLGHLSPLDGIDPGDLTADALLHRIDDPSSNAQTTSITEIIFGLSPNLEGDGTVLYLADAIGKRDIKLSRLARGVPSGSQLEYANKAVLADAITGRQLLEDTSS